MNNFMETPCSEVVTPVGRTAAVFDTGTNLIVGDPTGIQNFYEPLSGAEPLPSQGGVVIYTSTWANSVADQLPPNV